MKAFSFWHRVVGRLDQDSQNGGFSHSVPMAALKRGSGKGQSTFQIKPHG
jgi:hypothetical protein